MFIGELNQRQFEIENELVKAADSCVYCHNTGVTVSAYIERDQPDLIKAKFRRCRCKKPITPGVQKVINKRGTLSE